MSYSYKVMQYYQVKKDGQYPWPCKDNKKRTIELFSHDILSKNTDGTFFRHTGIGCFGIILKKNQVQLFKKPAELVVI